MGCVFLNEKIDLDGFNEDSIKIVDDVTLTVSIGLKDIYKMTAIFQENNVYDCSNINDYYRLNNKVKYSIGASFKEENTSKAISVGYKSVKDYEKFNGSFPKEYKEYILAIVNAYLFEKYFNEGFKFNNVNVNLIIALTYKPILFMKYQFEDCIGKTYTSVSSAYGKDVNVKINNLGYVYHMDILPTEFAQDFNRDCDTNLAMLTQHGILPVSFEDIFDFFEQEESSCYGKDSILKAKSIANKWFELLETKIEDKDFYYKYSNLYKDLKNIRKEFKD